MQQDPLDGVGLHHAAFYLAQVKYTFRDEPLKFSDFLHIMDDYNYNRIDKIKLMHQISNLFRGYTEMIIGFKNFLGHDDRLEFVSIERSRS